MYARRHIFRRAAAHLAILAALHLVVRALT